MTTLVLLPGLDGTGLLFEPLLKELSSDWTITVVRYPGDEIKSYAELEAIAKTAIPEKGDYLLLGESFSGPIAVSLAAQADDRLKGLILCCTFIENPFGIETGLLKMLSFFPLALVPGLFLNASLLGSFSTPELECLLSSTLSQVEDRVIKARMDEVLDVDVTSIFERLELPILYLRASQDILIPTRASQQVLNTNPNTTEAVIEAPHCMLQVKPQDVDVAIRQFADNIFES